MRQLAGEIITGKPADTYKNADMDRGNAMEAQARAHYALMSDAELTKVGFIRNGRVGCSPDDLVGTNGLAEYKTQIPDLLIETLLRDAFPTEHRAQCQGNLWVAEREWIDITVFWPGMPAFMKRAHRDEAYIRNLSIEVEMFNAELDALVEKIRRYGAPVPAQAAA